MSHVFLVLALALAKCLLRLGCSPLYPSPWTSTIYRPAAVPGRSAGKLNKGSVDLYKTRSTYVYGRTEYNYN